MLFFYQTKRAANQHDDAACKIDKKVIFTGGNKMVGIIAVAGIIAVSGALTYEFEEKIAPKENR